MSLSCTYVQCQTNKQDACILNFLFVCSICIYNLICPTSFYLQACRVLRTYDWWCGPWNCQDGSSICRFCWQQQEGGRTRGCYQGKPVKTNIERWEPKMDPYLFSVKLWWPAVSLASTMLSLWYCVIWYHLFDMKLVGWCEHALHSLYGHWHAFWCYWSAWINLRGVDSSSETNCVTLSFHFTTALCLSPSPRGGLVLYRSFLTPWLPCFSPVTKGRAGLDLFILRVLFSNMRLFIYLLILHSFTNPIKNMGRLILPLFLNISFFRDFNIDYKRSKWVNLYSTYIHM